MVGVPAAQRQHQGARQPRRPRRRRALFAGNLVNRPFYIVNGGRDPLYPVEHVATHVEAFKQLGVSLVFRPQADAGHDTSWWPYERGLFEQFVKQKPRVAHPARVSWETERIDDSIARTG